MTLPCTIPHRGEGQWVRVEGPQAFRPKKRCPKNDVFLFFWGLMGVERGGMDLVWVKSVFWFVKYVDFYVIFL